MARLRIRSTFGVGHTPQLLWPEDHGWIVATEINSNSTLLGGPDRLIQDILADGRLEAFEVAPESDLV